MLHRIYGFYDECKRRYSIKLWKTFTDCFNCLPLGIYHIILITSQTYTHSHTHTHTYSLTCTVALVEEKILCMHGGLSPDLHDLNQVSITLYSNHYKASLFAVCIDKRVGASVGSP